MLPFGEADLSALPAPGGWRPIPPSTDRSAWDSLPGPTRTAVVAAAEAERGRPWPILSASDYTRFFRDGDRVGYEIPYFARRARLRRAALAAAVTGDRDWLDEVVDGVWLICEETSWCLPAHHQLPADGSQLPDPARPTVDLFQAETAGELAFLDFIVGEAIGERQPIVRARLREEIRRRVLDPFAVRDDFWWFGAHGRKLNNWTPWICSNLLAGALLVAADRASMETTVRRVLAALERFLDGYPADGGCDEGPSYFWRAGVSLFECLETLYSASGGALDAFDVPLIRRIARYPLATHIDGRWQVNFADGSAKFGVEPLHLLHAYGRRVKDPEVMAHAAGLRQLGVDELAGSLPRVLTGLFDADWLAAPAADVPQPREMWLPDVQVLTAREQAGSGAGLFLAAKGGHNAESHNHNDVGSFIIAFDGAPVVVDAGVGVYTRQTFSPDRYRIWTMQSSFHNLPDIDGTAQSEGPAFRARAVSADLGPDAAALRMDIAAAYPPAAGAIRWTRAFRMERTPVRILVADDWELDHDPASLTWNLLIHGEPIIEPGLIAVSGVRITIVPELTGEAEAIPLDDERLSPVWGRQLTRVRLVWTAPARSGSLRMAVCAASYPGETHLS